MARNHGKISTGIYQNPEVRALPEDARWLLQYLCTSPHSNAAGCYILPLAYISHDLQWPLERVSKAFDKLMDKPFVRRDTANDMVCIPGWWDENKPENPNVAIHIIGLLSALPDCDTKSFAISNMMYFPGFKKGVHETLLKAFPNPSEYLSKPFRKPEPEPEPEPELPPSEGADAPLKARIFGPVLEWLARQTKKHPDKLRPLLGKWCSSYGDGAVLEALTSAARNSPLDPVPYIERILKPKAQNGKPDAKTVAASHLEGLAHVFGVGAMEPEPRESANEGRTIDGDFSIVGGDETGDAEGIRGILDGPDPIRGSVRDCVPGPESGAGDLPRATKPPAGRSAEPGDCSSEDDVDMGQQDAVSSGYPEQGRGGIHAAEDAVVSSESSGAEGSGRGPTEERHCPGEVEKSAKDARDDFPDIPPALDRRHEFKAA